MRVTISLQILGSLVHHQVTFLSSPEWRSRPWSVYSKNPVDRCLDALFMLPPVQCIWEAVRDKTDADDIRDRCNKLIREATKIDVMLQAWLEQFRHSVAGPLYWPEFSTLKGTIEEDEPVKLFPISFYFPAFTICFQMTTYWSGMMVVHDLLMNAYQKLSTLDLSHESLAREHEQVWFRMVRNMCQCVEYFERPENGKVGLGVCSSILKGCYCNLYGYAGRWVRERAWIQQMIGRINEKLNISTTT